MTPTASVTLRRAQLGQILTTMPGEACRLLLHLVRGACPRTGRVWMTALRAADHLNLPVTLVDELLVSLISAGHVSLWSRGTGGLRCYALGPLYVLVHEAPMNLPVESDP